MKQFLALFPFLACFCVPLGLRAQFVDKASVAGVNISYPTDTSGHTDPALDPNGVGSASCVCDLDGDGWMDIIVTRAGQSCLVFMNNRDGTFREEAALRGLDTVSDIGGIAAGDLANKGSPDLFMVPVSGPRYFLFVNDGTGHFTEKAIDRGADSTVTDPLHQGQSVSLVDYDRDGYLDIYVTEWGVAGNGQNSLYSVLLHNKGSSAPGFFENKTAAAGLVQPVTFIKHSGYSAAWADLDGDGYPDLFLAGDFGTSQLWWNNGDGTFTNGTASSGVATMVDGMGVSLLDYDGDGKIDIFVTAISVVFQGNGSGYISDNKLFRNLGNRQFAEVSTPAGVKNSGWGWGTGSLDANNDGFPDLVVTNGYYTAVNTTFQADPTKLFINRGGYFSDFTTQYGITDTGLGRGAAVLDYDNDGREDIFITNTVGPRILYHNENASANAHWMALRFVGATSNRDGYGCQVTLTTGTHNQTAIYNPTNAYIGQRESRLHFGLGASTVADKVTVTWPSGTVQTLTNLAADQIITLAESAGVVVPPTITSDLADVTVLKDASATLSIAGQGSPAPVYAWYKNGVKIAGQTGATLTISRVEPIDAGGYSVSLINQYGTAWSRTATLTVTADLGSKSVARWWDEANLDGIRLDIPNPPVHARNLFHLSSALWDAYWAYERNGWTDRQAMYDQENVGLPADEPGRLAAQQKAMSYAAYTVIKQRYKNSAGSVATLAGIRWLMQQYGYNPDFSDATGSSPDSVGLRIGQQIVSLTLNDGSNEANNYADATGFAAANPPLVVRNPGVGANVNPDFWQPLDLVNTVTQNGIVLGSAVQKFVGSNAINTQAFALQRNANRFPVDDPGAPPTFSNAATRATYVQQAEAMIQISSQLTIADGMSLDISPGHILNNTLGANDGQGHPTNPYTGQPYASNVVLRGDYQRVLAEFWADGPNSETPPGHWNLLFNQVSDNPLCTHQFGGTGSPLPRLQWDVVGYMALNAALHDAACAAWSLKWEYDSARPITMIRYLASLGQSSDSSLANYNADGLPLVPGLIEVITAQSSAAGQRHAALAASVGQIAIQSWLGTPSSPTQTSGVGWMLAANWVPYQKNTFVTPAFPGFISGHSTFSRAGAEVLTRLTGDEYFPGGMASYDYPAGTLTFEAGPAQHVQLQWATYYDASDQAGLSRLYGGIHIAVDDFAGRVMGSKVGINAFSKFLNYYNAAPGSLPTVTQQPAPVAAASGQTAMFSVAAASGGAVAYQWQRLAAGGYTWINLTDGSSYSGTTTATMTVNSLAAGMNGDQFRCVVTNSSGSTTSDAATLILAQGPNGISYNSTTFPTAAAPGAMVTFSYNVTNTGTNAWGPDHYLVLRDAALVQSDPNHANLAFASLNGVAPGASISVTLQFAVPANPGSYTYYVQGLENNVAWFSTRVTLGLLVNVATTACFTADFNGDGKADILWSNASNGDRYLWLMNGASVASSIFVGTIPTQWMAAAGDFNGDGKADILWSNTASGDRYLWLMNGGSVTSSMFLGTVGTQWTPAIGDFDGDGKADILWSNTANGDRYLWLMNGGSVAASIFLGTVPTQWAPVIGDFNADGKADILWSNTANGDRYLWLMNGGSVTSSIFLGTVPIQWTPVSGDFNADGKADILWSNNADGDRYLWLMNGGSVTSSLFLGTVPIQWTPATGDFNGDAKADILWSNASSGDRYLWLMNGGSVTNSIFLGTVAPLWQVGD